MAAAPPQLADLGLDPARSLVATATLRQRHLWLWRWARDSTAVPDWLWRPGEAEEGVLALAQPAPVGGLEEDLIEKSNGAAGIGAPEVPGAGSGLGEGGPALLSGAAETAAETMRRTI